MSTPYHRVVRLLEARGLRRGREFCCPAHEDQNPSLSISEGAGGRVLVTCHAGCSTEAVVAALGLRISDLFGPDGSRDKGEPRETYDYCDENGTLLYQVCRFEPKAFRQRRPSKRGGWTWNLKGARRVLYRVPDLLSRPDVPVFVVEGEKDADRLHDLGLTATTNPMGAGKWRKEYGKHLSGRDVLIIPDNDAPGREHANAVARSLRGAARTVKIIGLPGLREKGDVSDWLVSHSKEELLSLADATPEHQHDAGAGESEDEIGLEESARNRTRESLAKRLIPVVIGTGVELFHDQRGDGFAAVSLDGGRRIMSLRSREFSEWLSCLCWRELDSPLSSEQLSCVRNVLAGMARFDGRRYELSVRCAADDRCFWIDLDGRRAVHVAPGRWKVVDVPPIMFRPFAHQRPLPDPVPGGDPRRVLEFINLRDECDKVLFLCYLVVGFVPGIPIAALVVHGVQGSTKTTLLRIVKSTLDPSAVAVRGGVRDQSEFALAAFQNRVLLFDNLTGVPDWLSDALCRSVTGEGWSKRTLYTDEDATVLEYRGMVGLSGINLVADRADLLDRALILELEPVAPNRRLQESDLWRDFEEARPHIFGGLLDALSWAMQVEPGLMLRSLPRMADFARWGAAAAVGLRLNPLDFLQSYQRNVGRQNEAAIEASPVAQAVLAFMREQKSWEGTPGDLHLQLGEIAEQLKLDLRSRLWPKSPSWLSRRLKEVQPNLLAMGLKLEVGEARTPGFRTIGITTLRSSTPDAVTGQVAWL